MSSHAQDQSTQSAASAGAQANDTQLAANAKKNQQFADQSRQSLFGNYDSSTGKYSGGSESQYLDPSSLNQNGLSGTYQNQYNNASNAVAKGTNDAVASSQQNMANRGMGKSPAGFEADQERKAYQDQAATEGNLYTGAANQQHSDAMTNFQNANNMLNANATNTSNLSVQGNQAAAGNYSSLYGAASTQVANPWATAAGSVAGLGTAAAGFMPK